MRVKQHGCPSSLDRERERVRVIYELQEHIEAEIKRVVDRYFGRNFTDPATNTSHNSAKDSYL